ncbi:MAG: FHA domain-containing protein [Methylococcales bacterium]|nr:FHA domain-containing protein [Methylococcales bacterium]
MVKFTITLNNKKVKSLIFDKNIIHIGRNSDNDLFVDHPDAAPIHATVTQKGHAYIITQNNAEYPLLINNEETKEVRLINNDKIMIDNYSIIFNSAKIIIPNKNDIVTKNYAAPLKEKTIVPNAKVQILSGQNIGRLISLKDIKVSFGKKDSNTAEISKKNEGFAITALQSNANITINHEPLGDKTIILNDNDMLLIDNISMQFFLEH